MLSVDSVIAKATHIEWTAQEEVTPELPLTSPPAVTQQGIFVRMSSRQSSSSEEAVIEPELKAEYRGNDEPSKHSEEAEELSIDISEISELSEDTDIKPNLLVLSRELDNPGTDLDPGFDDHLSTEDTPRNEDLEDADVDDLSVEPAKPHMAAEEKSPDDDSLITMVDHQRHQQIEFSVIPGGSSQEYTHEIQVHPENLKHSDTASALSPSLSQEVDKTVKTKDLETVDEITLKTRVLQVKTIAMELSEAGDVALMEKTEVETNTDLTEQHKSREREEVVLSKRLERPAISPAPSFRSRSERSERSEFDTEEPVSLLNVEEQLPVYVAISAYEPESDEVLSLHEGEQVEVLDDAEEDWWLVRKFFNSREGWVPGQYLKDKEDYDRLVEEELQQQIQELKVENSKQN